MKLTLLITFLFSLFFPQKILAQELVVPNSERLIVKFRPATPRFSRDNLITSLGISQTESLKLRDVIILKVPKTKRTEILEKLNKNLLIEYSEIDGVAEALEIPNDPNFGSQWGLTKIQAPGSWDVTHGSGSTDIAIVDTGINFNHPDLGGKITLSINCTISGCPIQTTTDPDGHGTHVAGIASAITNNGIGVSGLSWNGRLMSVKVLDDNGSGYYSWIANGIITATDNGARVINLSLGGTTASATLESAVNYAWGKGAVVVAAAGNNGKNRKLYPAYYDNVIAVAASDQNDKKASFSNYGTWVEIAAPGVSIYSTYGNSYANLSGTSMATPHVAGLAALLFGQNPGWNNSQVRNRIQSTADNISGTGTYYTYGRINACRAVGCVPATPLATPTATTTSTPITSPEPTAEAGTPTPTSIPTSSPKPWWCKYVPNHSTCQ